MTPAEQKKAITLLFAVMMMALFDVIGIASIMPFLAVLADPELVSSNPYLALIYSKLEFTSNENFFIFLGFSSLGVLISSLTFKGLTTYYQMKFALMREYSLCKRLVEGYLNQPYPWFLEKHSAELGKNILSEVSAVIVNGLMPLLTLLAQSIVVIAFLAFLLLINPSVSLIVGFTLVFSFYFIFVASKKFLTKTGESRIQANQARFMAINELFSGIKEVKVSSLEKYHIERFNNPAKLFAKHQASSQLIAQLPRYILEGLAFGGMILLILYIMITSDNLGVALPIIALYALAGYRLMPALQQIYTSASQLQFISPTLNRLHEDLKNLKPKIELLENEKIGACHPEIEIKNLSFQYRNSLTQTLSNINLKIAPGSMIGFAGVTGSGKTTLIDVLLGLLEPNTGKLTINGQLINSRNCHNWQKLIGYVPQQIYLSDDSILSNIAFGLTEEKIDKDKVINAAKAAKIHDFIINELKNGYHTKVGERGARLSGGQCQRIGIARALYKSPKVLILDEATSALDNLTEQAVMNSLENLTQRMTLILIAHRLSTLQKCNQIYVLKDGQIVESGTYSQLSEKNKMFSKVLKEAKITANAD